MRYLRISIVALLVILLTAATIVLSQGKKQEQVVSKYSSALCTEHGIADSLCTRCHPELAAVFKKKGDWCAEHRLPESQDDLCHPELARKMAASPSQEDALQTPSKKEMSPAGYPETALHRTNADSCATDQAVIQLTSVETFQRAGMQIEAVQTASLSETITAPAVVEFDAMSSYAVTSLVGGTVVKWLVEPGEHVRQGQRLALLQSIEGASLKAEYSHAQTMLNLSKNTYDRAQSLSKDGMSSTREVQEAEADYLRAQADARKADGALQALGMSELEISNLADNDGSGATVPICAGQSGILVDQRIALGAVLSPGESIGMISQTDKLWVEAQVRERDISRIKPGQSVMISSDGHALNRAEGVVNWVAAEVDPLTRMGKVRIETHPDGAALKAHQFVRVEISTSGSEETIMIPQEAVQWEGCCNVVFVSETRDRFRPRKVGVEFSSGSKYAVSGLRPGEKIVTHGSYMLKTELMKSSIGAGCCGTGA